MLKHAKGNLIDMAEQGLFSMIVHGCNCLNTMGSGIARELRERYPEVYEADTIATKTWQNPVAKLGNFSYTVAGGKIDKHPFVVINAYTQVNFEPRNIDHFEYESFSLILRKLLAISSEGSNVGFPYIGMGLAGGDSTRIIPMIEDFAKKINEVGGTATLVEFG